MKAGGMRVCWVQGRLAVSKRRLRGHWVPRLPSQGRGPEDLPASERSRRELLSAPRLSPSPAPYVSSRLLRANVPFTESLAPPVCEVLGRIIPFCFSSSAGWQWGRQGAKVRKVSERTSD